MNQYKAILESLNQQPNLLYHATLKVFKESILKSGIIAGGQDCQLWSWCDMKYVYLADDRGYAAHFVESALSYFDDEDIDKVMLYEKSNYTGVVFVIDKSKLDLSKLNKDPEIEFIDGSSNSYAYYGNIPAEAIISNYEFNIEAQ
jgi:hypothetical protein